MKNLYFSSSEIDSPNLPCEIKVLRNVKVEMRGELREAYVVECVSPVPGHWEKVSLVLARPNSFEDDAQYWVTNVYAIEEQESSEENIVLDDYKGMDKGTISTSPDAANSLQARLPSEDEMRAHGFPEEAIAQVREARKKRI